MSTYNPESSFRRGTTRSAGHSPASSPRDLSTNKLNLNGHNLFGNTVSNTSNNVGWVGWGGSSLAPKRHASGSSTASGAGLVTSTADSSFVSHPSEGWQSSRPKSATWEEARDSIQRKDQSQQDFALSNISGARQASYPGARPDDRSSTMGSKQQRYGNPLASEFGGPRLPTVFNNAAFVAPHPLPSGAVAYPGSNLISNTADNELSMAMRGMTVGDESHPHAASQDFISIPLPQSAGLYSGFTPTDYSGYYSNTTVAPFIPGHPAGNTPQIGVYYDFSATPAAPYYYAAQPMLYPTHSPMLTPQLPHSSATTIAEKKAEAQFNTQQQMATSHPLARPSHAPRGYRASMDYTSRGRGQSGYLHRYGAHSVSIRRYPEKPRSPLLEEYRADRSRRWETRDIYGYIAEFSTDQHGSRFVQTKIEQADPEEKQKIFDELAPGHIIRLVQDVFGNYVIQKFFEFGTPAQKATLAGAMRGHLVPLSMQMYGCRVIQKAIECLSPEWQSQFVQEIRPQVLKCVKDSNGNHVVQKLIEKVPSERVAFVQSFCGNVYELATHAYGCRVLQRCLEHLPEDITRPLLDELYECALGLMQDQFGNYVVQFVIAQGSTYDKRRVISTLFGQMLNMSRHKFASNVCEKALLLADPADRRVLIQEIISPQADGNVPIAVMMKDSFANYVLQRALECADDEQKEALVSRIKPHLSSIRRFSTTYSKHITSIERDLGKTVDPFPQSGLNTPDSKSDIDSTTILHQS